MPRADLRTPANKDFGKPGVTYPWGDLAYPSVVVEKDGRQNQTPPAFLGAYSDNGTNYTAALLTGISKPPGDNQNANQTLRYETLPGPELIHKGFDIDSGASPNRVVRQKVALPASPVPLDNTPRTFDGLVMYPQDSSVEPIDSITGWKVTTYLDLPGPELIRKGYDLDTGAPTRVVRQKVTLPASPTAQGATRVFDGITMEAQDSYVEPTVDSVTGWLVTTYQQLPTALITVYDQDEETLINVVTSYRVVGYPITPPTPTLGIIINYKKIDSQKALEITRDYTAFLDYSYTEQRFSADTFPALFDYTQYEYTDACGPFSQIRASFSTSVQTTTVISFHDGPESIDGLTLIPKTLQLGRGVQISADVLVDSGSFQYEGNCTGLVTFTGSTPDYTTYTTMIMGSSQLKTGESVLWKARIWRTTRVYQIFL